MGNLVSNNKISAVTAYRSVPAPALKYAANTSLKTWTEHSA